MKRNVLFLLLSLLSASLACAFDDIPYEDNDNSYVVIPNQENTEPNGEFKVYDKVDVKDFAAPNCKEVPLSIDRCISAICVDKEQFGKTFRKIKGSTADGSCEYEERTPGFGGIDCIFPAAKLGQLNKAFQIQFFGFTQSSLTDEEKTEFKNTMDMHCKPVKDSALTSAVKVTSDVPQVADAQSVVPVPSPSEQPKVTTVPIPVISEPRVNTTPVASEKVKVAGDSNDKTEDAEKEKSGKETTEFTLKSVMFTPEEIDQINSILSNFGISDDIAGSLVKADAKSTSRKFYLNSLIYYSNDKWAVWINSQKISNDGNEVGLVIREITKEYVVVEWSTPNLETIAPDWRSRLTAVSRNKFVSPKKDIEVYLPDETSALVSFRLSPNQLFEVNNMRIKEGDIG